MLLSCFKPGNGNGLARIQDCPNSHLSKTSDNCDIGAFVLVLEVSFRMKVISSPKTYTSLIFLTLFIPYNDKKLLNVLCKSWKQASRVTGLFGPKRCLCHILDRFCFGLRLKQAPNKPAGYHSGVGTCRAKTISYVDVPFFRSGHLVPLFGSLRPIFYNGF